MIQRRDASPLPPDITVFYGSSSIRLWETLAEDFADIPVLNLGFGGSTLGACVYYFDALIPPCHPRALLCYAGENDIGDGRKPDAIVNDFRALHAQVAALPGDIPFAFLSIKPSPHRWPFIDRIRDVNRRIAAEIATRPQSHFVDVFTPMLNDNHLPRPELWTEDGIHMSRDGYRVWWQALSAQRREIGI